MTTTTCELEWLHFLLQDFQVSVPLPCSLFYDNKAAQQIAANPWFHEHTKHLEIDWHFTQTKSMLDSIFQTTRVSSQHQLAHFFTKGLAFPQHSFLTITTSIVEEEEEEISHFFVFCIFTLAIKRVNDSLSVMQLC